MAKKTKAATRSKAKPKKPVKPKKTGKSKMAKAKPARSAKRVSWVDAKTQTPMIDSYAKQLDSFIKTMADGRVDESEIKAQEKRLVDLMKKVEPMLDDAQHQKITELLCELNAYDVMQMLYTIHESRPETKFHG